MTQAWQRGSVPEVSCLDNIVTGLIQQAVGDCDCKALHQVMYVHFMQARELGQGKIGGSELAPTKLINVRRQKIDAARGTYSLMSTSLARTEVS